jgi:hypothetical protein
MAKAKRVHSTPPKDPYEIQPAKIVRLDDLRGGGARDRVLALWALLPWVRRNALDNRAPRSRIGLAELSRRKVIRHRQRAALVGFQGNLLGQHDVARDKMIVRYEAPARSRPASVV